MKKISIEENIKCYNDKLKLAKEALDSGSYDKETIEYIFPELKESEDERIKKNLITFFKGEYGTNSNARFAGIKVKDVIAWLEKQSEPTSLQINERAWLYLVSDVLTWTNGIGQYLDDPRVQELAKKLRNEYAQKLIEY